MRACTIAAALFVATNNAAAKGDECLTNTDADAAKICGTNLFCSKFDNNSATYEECDGEKDTADDKCKCISRIADGESCLGKDFCVEDHSCKD